MTHLVNFADEELGSCDVRMAFEKAPHAPIAGTSAVSTFNEKAHVDLLFLGDPIVAHARDVFPKYPLLLPVQAENPQDAWDLVCGGRLGLFGPPNCILAHEGGEWRNEIWTDLRAKRRIRLQFQGVVARPVLLGRRNGLARGIYNRLIEDDRFMNKTILSESQWRPNTMLSASGFPARQTVFRPNPADLSGWEDGDDGLTFARDTSPAGQFVQQCELRMRAQEATLGEIANSKLRRLLARNNTGSCAEIDVGDMALVYKERNRKISPRRKGPAEVLEIDETGVTVSCRSRNFEVARYCVRQRMKESEVAEGEEFPESR